MDISDKRNPLRTWPPSTRPDRLYSRSLVRSLQSANTYPSALASDGGGHTPLPPSQSAWEVAKDPWCSAKLVASGTRPDLETSFAMAQDKKKPPIEGDSVLSPGPRAKYI